MTAPEREALVTGLDAMARQIGQALDYDVAQRSQEGLETTPDTHLMSPPSWPSHGCLRYWIKALDQAREMLSAPPAVTVTEEMVDAAAKAIAWDHLTPKGRETCDWLRDFAEVERQKYRSDARMALQAALKSTTPQTGSQE
jgi:hypothetical protein